MISKTKFNEKHITDLYIVHTSELSIYSSSMYPRHTPTPSFVDNFHDSAMVTGSDMLSHCYEDGLIIQPSMVGNLK